MTTITSVVQQFVAGLKSRNEETRSATARDLKQYVSTELKEVLPDDVSTFMDEFNHQILEMVSSQDTSEKKGAILAIGNFFLPFEFFVLFSALQFSIVVYSL